MTGPEGAGPSRAGLTPDLLARVRATADVLLPGSPDAPAPSDIADFDDLVQRAAAAVGGSGGRELVAAVESLPDDLSWEGLAEFADRDPTQFDQVSLLVVGAYFLSPAVLQSLGLPTGDRRAADREQVVDELDSGILDAVFERGCPVRTLDEVNGASR